MFQYIFDNNYMQTYSGGVSTRPVGTLAGQSIKILNFTMYDIQVIAAGSQLIDVIPAYQFLVMDNTPDLSLSVTGSISSSYKYMNPYVAVKTSPDKANYELGTLIHNLVTNTTAQPVPTSTNYYGTGADGVFNSTGNVVQNNPANDIAIYNYTSFTLNSGHTLSFNNQAKYVLIYSQGDIVINGTLQAANGMSNISQGNGLTINGKTVLNAGNGGNGGAGGATTGSGGSGGTGGTGNCFSSGCGGGGGGGYDGSNSGLNGASGGVGYGTATPVTLAQRGWSGSVDTDKPATCITTANPTQNTATLCLVAGGNIIINGTVFSKGGDGQHGAAGANNVNTYCGDGGNSGTNSGGCGGWSSTSGASYAGGGGSGGAGGGCVFIFCGSSFQNNGTVNVNGGNGGTGGVGSTTNIYNGNNGLSGTSGTIQIYQMGGNLSS